jgi:prepilin-type N-terminal cleavage/methylation domain-containing protein
MTWSCAKARLCYNARSSFTPMFPREDTKRPCSGGCVSRRPAHQLRIVDLRLLSQHERTRASRHAVALCEGGFTLLELLIVISIIAVLLVLIAPAFTTVKSSTDVTSAAYAIKGVLDTTRMYAKANNTCTLLEAFSRATGVSCLAFWEFWPPVSVELREFSKEPTPPLWKSRLHFRSSCP